jgi:hypothetical protein
VFERNQAAEPMELLAAVGYVAWSVQVLGAITSFVMEPRVKYMIFSNDYAKPFLWVNLEEFLIF